MSSQSNSALPRTAVFTIVSKNYVHYARVLMRSLRETNSEWERYVLLADRLEGAFDPAAEDFAAVESDVLPLPEREKFLFRYTIVELNTAVKPWFFRYLFEQGFDRVVYLDPDIYMFAPLREVENAFADGALAVLVPHLTGRLRDKARPSEHDVLQSGAYNLGFCALARHRELDALLEFWCEKSVRDFAVDLSRGLFTDQRWMDLVPGMFADVRILRHEGYDVAYWNMPHRHVTHGGDRYWVNGVPLIFFHFSGIDPLHPQAFSKHQNRYSLTTVSAVGELTRRYCARLEHAGAAVCGKWAYAFGRLHDGSPIPDILRRFYRTTSEVEKWAGEDPFSRGCDDWSESISSGWPPLSRAMLAVYQARPDIRLTWPDIFGTDREAFARWFVETAELQAIVPDCFIRPIRTALEQRREEHRAESRRPSRGSWRPRLMAGAIRKALIAAREHRLPLSPRKWLQLYRLHTIETAQEFLARQSPPLPSIGWPDESASRETGALTLVGYLDDATGVAAGAHGSIAACRAAGIETELIDARSNVRTRGRNRTSLLQVNADQTPSVARALGDDFFRDRYTIGVWAWELPDFPEAYVEAFDWVDEVWAMSRFVQQAVAERSPVPVLHMPLAVPNGSRPSLGRRDLGLPDDRFLFLMMYDTLSVQERKNPLGALAAFERAFPNPRGVGLVVKVNHAASRPEDVAIVRQRVAEVPGALLIDRWMSREDAQALQGSCDALLSLHRSEGFGLNIAEAMLLGKPVVVTGWSGNMDFTTDRNACLVDYRLVTIGEDHGPYRKGSHWADPDLDSAAEAMRRLVSDGRHRDAIGAKARETIAQDFSPRVIGARYKRRLDAIHHLRRLPAN